MVRKYFYSKNEFPVENIIDKKKTLKSTRIFFNDSLFLHMWSFPLACQIYTIILVAVDLFNIGNRRVKEFLKLVPT